MVVSGARKRDVGLSIGAGWVCLSKSMYYNTEKGSLLPMISSLSFCSFIWLVSKFTENPSSHIFPNVISQWSFMAGRTYMRQDFNNIYGMERRVVFDEHIVVVFGCLTYPPFSNRVFSVTSTLFPQQCTVNPETK